MALVLGLKTILRYKHQDALLKQSGLLFVQGTVTIIGRTKEKRETPAGNLIPTGVNQKVRDGCD